MATPTVSQVGHPLEPLSPEEIIRAVEILRDNQRLPEQHQFVQVTLHEPSKDYVLSYRNGDGLDREASVIMIDKTYGRSYRGIVSISQAEIRSWEQITEGEPPITFAEFVEFETTCKQSPAFQEALSKRGVTDPESIMIDPWPAGVYEDSQGRRLARGLAWVWNGAEENGYAHPIENLVVVVDLNKMEVVAVEDYGVVPVPQESSNFTPDAVGALRSDLKPLEIHQPEGPSFEVDGHHVRWQKWQFRIGFTPREGLVLHTLTYEDQGRQRPVLYRASLSEMVVPYGDVAPTHRRKNAFDAGEANMGMLANALELGCDCLGEIRYFDAHVADPTGNPMTLSNAVCLHEEDFGILWKHLDLRTFEAEVRRSRRLVISWIATVGNYDYGFYWYLYQDGTIEFEVKLTGILSTGALEPGQRSKFGQVLNPDGLYAPIHQHFFNVRLDLDIDGQANEVYEIEVEPETEGEHNPEHSGFYQKATLLDRESNAQRMVDPLKGRHWKIINPSVTNRVGDPVAYRLEPHTNSVLHAAPAASVHKRAMFTTRNLWVTPYAPGERHAAGDFPNQHRGGAGLPEWTKADRNLRNEDLVLWYTFGEVHMPRLEDWPVMPVTTCGFTLRAVGFFDRSPALDVPPMHVAHQNGHDGHQH